MTEYYKLVIRLPKGDKTMEKKECIIVDLEGTLTDCSHRIKYWEDKNYNKWNELFSEDLVNKQMVDIIQDNRNMGRRIIICTAKSVECAEEVNTWLYENSIPGLSKFQKRVPILSIIDSIYYREKSSNRISLTVKAEMLSKIKKRYTVVRAYDDRSEICKMYRDNGVSAILVEPATIVKKDKEQDIEPDAKWLGLEVKNNPGSPADLLHKAADLFEKRDKAYGSSYKQFGEIVLAFFPDGIILKTEDDFTRWGLLNMIFSKINRYCNNFQEGGHPDSLADLSVYSAMLAEIDKVRKR